jgi:hypothetical protein
MALYGEDCLWTSFQPTLKTSKPAETLLVPKSPSRTRQRDQLIQRLTLRCPAIQAHNDALSTTFINECSIVHEEPITYRHAVSGKHYKEWLLAIASNLDSFRERGVLELIPLNRMNGSGRAVGTLFVFKI